MKDRRLITKWHKEIVKHGFKWFRTKRKRPVKDRRK